MLSSAQYTLTGLCLSHDLPVLLSIRTDCSINEYQSYKKTTPYGRNAATGLTANVYFCALLLQLSIAHRSLKVTVWCNHKVTTATLALHLSWVQYYTIPGSVIEAEIFNWSVFSSYATLYSLLDCRIHVSTKNSSIPTLVNVLILH